MDPDFHIRLAAIARLQSLQLRYEDMIPRREIMENIVVDGEPYALFNPQAGIHRPRRFRGPAALTIVTAAPNASRPPPYDDAFDEATGTIVYSYRDGHIASIHRVGGCGVDWPLKSRR